MEQHTRCPNLYVRHRLAAKQEKERINQTKNYLQRNGKCGCMSGERIRKQHAQQVHTHTLTHGDGERAPPTAAAIIHILCCDCIGARIPGETSEPNNRQTLYISTRYSTHESEWREQKKWNQVHSTRLVKRVSVSLPVERRGAGAKAANK